jgi:antitoxin VapB
MRATGVDEAAGISHLIGWIYGVGAVPGLYVKHPDADAIATRVARRLGTTKTQAVISGLKKLEAELPPEGSTQEGDVWRWLRSYKERFPPLKPTGLKADKAFYDELSGDI